MSKLNSGDTKIQFIAHNNERSVTDYVEPINNEYLVTNTNEINDYLHSNNLCTEESSMIEGDFDEFLDYTVDCLKKSKWTKIVKDRLEEKSKDMEDEKDINDGNKGDDLVKVIKKDDIQVITKPQFSGTKKIKRKVQYGLTKNKKKDKIDESEIKKARGHLNMKTQISKQNENRNQQSKKFKSSQCLRNKQRVFKSNLSNKKKNNVDRTLNKDILLSKTRNKSNKSVKLKNYMKRNFPASLITNNKIYESEILEHTEEVPLKEEKIYEAIRMLHNSGYLDKYNLSQTHQIKKESDDDYKVAFKILQNEFCELKNKYEKVKSNYDELVCKSSQSNALNIFDLYNKKGDNRQTISRKKANWEDVRKIFEKHKEKRKKESKQKLVKIGKKNLTRNSWKFKSTDVIKYFKNQHSNKQRQLTGHKDMLSMNNLGFNSLRRKNQKTLEKKSETLNLEKVFFHKPRKSLKGKINGSRSSHINELLSIKHLLNNM